jgi:Peptidase A4 family
VTAKLRGIRPSYTPPQMKKLGGALIVGVLIFFYCIIVPPEIAGASPTGAAHPMTPVAVSPNWGTTTIPFYQGPPSGSAGSIHASDEASSNWAGYVATGGEYTGSSAAWTVPTIQPSQSLQEAAQWVGVDGFGDSNLIQTGVTEATENGQTIYFAWYEIDPAINDAVTFAEVSPGDVVGASVAEESPGVWSIVLVDDSVTTDTETTYEGNFDYDGPGLSAETVVEEPDVNGQQVALADFGSVEFTPSFDSTTSTNTTTALDIVDNSGNVRAYPNAIDPSGDFAVTYQALPSPPAPTPPTPPTPTPPTSTPPPPATTSGYTLVGSDGGVFAFGSATFIGSLPGLGVSADNVKGIVASSDDKGYFMVGADGGVFAFGDTSFENSLPGLGVSVGNIVGIVPTADDRGYFLVGSDGGVFAFGDSSYEGSLPGSGIHVTDVVGIAATPDDHGYWVLEANGTVTAFGDAANHGAAVPGAVAITADPAGGYWVTTASGAVFGYGAPVFGSASNVNNIVSLVPTPNGGGYWLIGSNGSVAAYGDAPFDNSLPGLGVTVDNIVGGVPA